MNTISPSTIVRNQISLSSQHADLPLSPQLWTPPLLNLQPVQPVSPLPPPVYPSAALLPSPNKLSAQPLRPGFAFSLNTKQRRRDFPAPYPSTRAAVQPPSTLNLPLYNLAPQAPKAPRPASLTRILRQEGPLSRVFVFVVLLFLSFRNFSTKPILHTANGPASEFTGPGPGRG